MADLQDGWGLDSSFPVLAKDRVLWEHGAASPLPAPQRSSGPGDKCHVGGKGQGRLTWILVPLFIHSKRAQEPAKNLPD